MIPRLTLRQHLQTLSRSWAMRQAAGLLVFYVLFGWVFDRETAERGLFDAAGRPDTVVACLGVVYLLVRVATRLLVPAFVVYALTDRVLRHLYPPPPTPPEPAPTAARG
jgi:hypothetical protein